MLNQSIIFGRIINMPTKKENKQEVVSIVIAIPRQYKNANGEYGTDFIKCSLSGGIANNTLEYCKIGDLIGVKGCLRSRDIKVNDETITTVEVMAEKITFLSSKANKDE